LKYSTDLWTDKYRQLASRFV